MKTSDRILEAVAVSKAASIIERMEARVHASQRGWREKQLADWRSLRLLCNGQIAQEQLNPTPEPEAPVDTTGALPLEPSA